MYEQKLGQIFLKFCATYHKEYLDLVHLSPTLSLINFRQTLNTMLSIISKIMPHSEALVLDNNMHIINPLTLELNPSAQRCLTRFFTGDFAS
jgi:hypothetical protein